MKILEGFLIVTLIISTIFGVSVINTACTVDEEFSTEMPNLFVYPQNRTVSVGEIVTITVCVSNLTENVYETHEMWKWGEPLPPPAPGGYHSYPLGFLWAFEVLLKWDPLILEYINRTVTVPVEDYNYPIPPVNFTGILHEPFVNASDSIDAEEGTYLVAFSSQVVPGEETPRYFIGNGTLLQINFRVKREGATEIKITHSKLSAPPATIWKEAPYKESYIPHKVINGYISTSGARTWISKVSVKALWDDKTADPPIIEGENATMEVNLKNDGLSDDIFNLTLYYVSPEGDTTLLKEWKNQAISPGELKVYNINISSSELTCGNNTVMANATILHGGEIFPESLPLSFKVVSPPSIQIAGLPSEIYVDEEVTLKALGNHTDPEGYITKFKWEIYEKGVPVPYTTLENQTVKFAFPFNKTWTIVLKVEDNFGITYQADRPATKPYMVSMTVTVKAKVEGGFPWDIVLLVVIIVAVIAALVAYKYRYRLRKG